MKRSLTDVVVYPLLLVIAFCYLLFCIASGLRLIRHGIRELRFRWLWRRRCDVSAADADWLADALGEHQCPLCDRELIRH